MPQNYLQAFRGPNLAEIDRAAYSNSLLRNEVQRLPQANKAQDLALQQAEQEALQKRVANAAGVLGRNFAMLAAAPPGQIKPMAQSFFASPEFETAGKLAELPPGFTVTEQDDEEQLRQQFTAWSQALSGQPAQQNRVHSMVPLANGNAGYLTQNGQIVDTGQKMRESYQVIDAGGGRALLGRGSGELTPITTPEQETGAAADRAGAEAWARAAAQAGVDLQNDKLAKQNTLGVWRVARQGLMSALGGTTTGPIAGRFPAVTAGQQIAEGAVAAVAPVLKQLFRSAGEGVFTDRDQQLLLDMVPKRTDLPDAISAKMQMIDAIIEAKLNASTSLQPPSAINVPRVGEIVDGYRYKGGNPSLESSWERQ